MKKIRYIVITLLLLLAIPTATLKAETGGEGEIDVNELIFGHIGDAYEWHVVSFGDTHLTIHLPVIVKSSTGWHVFCSSHLEGGEEYEGLYIAEGGANDGKIVERNAAGEEVRPFDISITKNVLGLFINSAILLIVMLGCARWYKKHPLEQGAPKGGVGMIEATVMSIYDDVIKGCVGEDYRRYAPYLLTAFFFVLVNNLMGLIPIFPGGATVTGNIAITMVLALCTFLFTNIFGTKAYWKEIFWPEVPTWLKVPIPMMPLTMARAGETVTIRKITGRDEVRQHLAEMGFVVDSDVTVISEVAGNLILQVKDSRIALDKSMANRIMI